MGKEQTKIRTMTKYHNIGIDIDGTLTKEKIDKDIMTSSKSVIEKTMLSLTPKDGIDVLFENNLKKFVITGRQEKFREVTTDWLDMYGIPYNELTMFPNDFYKINGYSIPKYVGLKVDIHIKKNIGIALDDNIEVVNALNMFGIRSCKVDDNFKDAFEKVFKMKDVAKGDNKEIFKDKSFRLINFIIG